jgi:hypothetical protein
VRHGLVSSGTFDAARDRGVLMRRGFILGGVVAGVLLIVLGAGTIIVGFSGRSEVRSQIGDEQLVGTSDMTPAGAQAALRFAAFRPTTQGGGRGIEQEQTRLSNVQVPDCSVAGEKIETGSEARCFAEYMRIQALVATRGRVYADMPQAIDKKTGNPVPDTDAARALAFGTAVQNPQLQFWVTETALATALDTGYFADQVSKFAIIVGIALVLIGIGLLVLTIGALRPQLEPPRPWRAT